MIGDEIRWTGQSAHLRFSFINVLGQIRAGVRLALTGLHTLSSPRLVFVIRVIFLVLNSQSFGFLHKRSLFILRQQPVEWASGKIHFHSERYLSMHSVFFCLFYHYLIGKLENRQKNNYRGERGIGSVICQSGVHYMHSVFTPKYDWITHKYNWF